MTKKTAITHIFYDIGGVLLTNGWDRHSRKEAAECFSIDREEMEERHQHFFDLLEIGKITLEEYLSWVVFYTSRPFTKEAFQKFLFAQSKPMPEMLRLAHHIKKKHGVKIIALSNEAREINEYRIRKYKLDSLIDTFISSCYVHVRKPDADIYRYALDISQAKKESVLYIENTALFIDVARKMGIRSLLHEDFRKTSKGLASMGLS